MTALLGHRPRTKTPTQIIAELDGLYALGWRKNIFFVDDNFIGIKKQIKSEVLPALIEWRKGKIGVPFSTEVSINLVDDPGLLRLMTQAGFDTVFVGIETPNEDSLTECSKNQNKSRDLVESVKQLQRAGLQVQGGFIVGFDNDPPSIFQQQIDFIQKSGIVTAMVGLLQAPPGTRLYEQLSNVPIVRGDRHRLREALRGVAEHVVATASADALICVRVEEVASEIVIVFSRTVRVRAEFPFRR